MKVSDLDFQYPEELVAIKPVENSRVMLVENNKFSEINKNQLMDKIVSGDVLVINDTKVIKRRLFSKKNNIEEFEFLFIESKDNKTWQVLCRSGRVNKDTKFILPENIEARIIATGIPQTVLLSKEIDNEYFEKYGEMPLPPYIQKARNDYHNQANDQSWYQTKWAEVPGSQAAPTASLHFTIEDIQKLKAKGVHVQTITLHVGLGTFLAVKADDLNDHKMHYEEVSIPRGTWDTINTVKKNGRAVWALGTTVTRALEACALNHLNHTANGFMGKTDLLIQEGFDFKVVDRILTNFHQPKSTLLALVCGFKDKKTVMNAYQWAIGNNFRLFSYGDLTAWIK